MQGERTLGYEPKRIGDRGGKENSTLSREQQSLHTSLSNHSY